MAAKTQVKLNDTERLYISTNFDAEANKNFSMKHFMKRKVYMLPDGTVGKGPLTLTGLRVPALENFAVTVDTTY